MKRFTIAAVLLLATLVATAPLLHAHPLVPAAASDGTGVNTHTVCGVCVAAAARLMTAPAVLATPHVIVCNFFAPPVTVMGVSTSAPLPSRAPPAS